MDQYAVCCKKCGYETKMSGSIYLHIGDELADRDMCPKCRHRNWRVNAYI